MVLSAFLAELQVEHMPEDAWQAAVDRFAAHLGISIRFVVGINCGVRRLVVVHSTVHNSNRFCFVMPEMPSQVDLIEEPLGAFMLNDSKTPREPSSAANVDKFIKAVTDAKGAVFFRGLLIVGVFDGGELVYSKDTLTHDGVEFDGSEYTYGKNTLTYNDVEYPFSELDSLMMQIQR